MVVIPHQRQTVLTEQETTQSKSESRKQSLNYSRSSEGEFGSVTPVSKGFVPTALTSIQNRHVNQGK
jgi:hypothetical protein